MEDDHRPGTTGARFALVLGGGAARGLAHIGVLEVLEREGVSPTCVVGTSMGALIGALWAAGLASHAIEEIARSFRFPRTFLPGGVLRWDALFGAATPALGGSFSQLRTPLLVTAVDLERGNQVILRDGALLPAVRASSSVPGLLPPVRLDGRWLIDGGIANVLPIDVAWIVEPDVVVAVDLGSPQQRHFPQLDWRATKLLSRLGELVPNPATAKISLELMVRASEIILARQTALATAMTAPDVLVQPDIGHIGLRDFGRLREAVAIGREAAEAALPRLREALAAPEVLDVSSARSARLFFDPVCAMVISPARSRASLVRDGTTYHFCSVNCRDSFVRNPGAYLSGAPGEKPE